MKLAPIKPFQVNETDKIYLGLVEDILVMKLKSFSTWFYKQNGQPVDGANTKSIKTTWLYVRYFSSQGIEQWMIGFWFDWIFEFVKFGWFCCLDVV